MIMKINSLSSKILNCKINNIKCKFLKQEIDFISRFTFYLEDIEAIKFLYYILNINNNLSEDFIENAKRIISISNLDIFDDLIIDNTIMSVPVKVLREIPEKINEKKMTINQSIILNEMRESNLVINASTGFGKTFLTSIFLIERYNLNTKEFLKKKQLLLVPTEILEEQILSRMKSNNKNLEYIIGNNPDVSDIVVCTPEKIYTWLINTSKENNIFDTIIIDEAHCILQKNERGEFLKEMLKLSINGDIKYIFISPFINIDSFEIFEKFYNEINLKYINVSTSKRNNKDIINDYINDKNILDVESIYSEGITLVYSSGVSDVIKLALSLKNDYRYLSERKEISEENLNIINDVEKKFNRKYIIFDLLKIGIAYLHSNMPNEVISLIINLVESGEIKIVSASSIIIYGMDLPFDNIIINKCKINKTNMEVNDFINLIGRTGRISTFKKTRGYGFIYLKSPCNDWYFKNKINVQELLKNNNNSVSNLIDEDEIVFFTKKSIEKYKESNDYKYIIDPRINPDFFINILDKVNVSDVDFIIEEFFINEKDLKKIKYIICTIFALYKVKEYAIEIDNIFVSDEYSFTDIYNNYSKSDSSEKESTKLRHLSKHYVKNNFNLSKSIKLFFNKTSFAMKDKDDELYSSVCESFIKNVKKYGKHILVMFVSHLSNFIISDKYGKFEEILKYKIVNKEFLNIISKSSFSAKWFSLLNEDQLIEKTIKNHMIKLIDNKVDDLINIQKRLNKSKHFKRIYVEDGESKIMIDYFNQEIDKILSK